jgi:hypothetical protein
MLRRALSSLPLPYPMDDTWRLMNTWIDCACAAGQRFGVGDLLIGALASEVDTLVWSLDDDVARRARQRLVRLYGLRRKAR